MATEIVPDSDQDSGTEARRIWPTPAEKRDPEMIYEDKMTYEDRIRESTVQAEKRGSIMVYEDRSTYDDKMRGSVDQTSVDDLNPPFLPSRSLQASRPLREVVPAEASGKLPEALEACNAEVCPGLSETNANAGTNAKTADAKVGAEIPATKRSATTKERTEFSKECHMICSLFGWGVLMPIAAFIGRYRRLFPVHFWSTAHAIIQVLVAGIAVADWFINLGRQWRVTTIHGVIAQVIHVGMACQLLFGFIRGDGVFQRNLHRVGGSLLVIASVLLCTHGMSLIEVRTENFAIYIIFVFAILLLMHIMDMLPQAPQELPHQE